MAMNLRLGPDAENALRAAAERSGRSQQDLLRDAVDSYLGLVPGPRRTGSGQDTLISRGVVLAPRTPYRRATPTLGTLENGSSLELLGRADRI